MVVLFFKLLTTPTLILVATLVSRRFGQATGGWLVGLPLTSGPIALFLAIEHGPGFSQLAAAGSLEGAVAQAFFATTYTGLARGWPWPICLFGASISFLASGLLVGELGLPTPALIFISRMAVATGLVPLITSVAPVIGPDLSGLAATFPLFAIVLAVFAHRQHGSSAAQSVWRGNRRCRSRGAGGTPNEKPHGDPWG